MTERCGQCEACTSVEQMKRHISCDDDLMNLFTLAKANPCYLTLRGEFSDVYSTSPKISVVNPN